MKASVIVSVALGASMGLATTLAELPSCSQNCLSSMLGKAGELGCPPHDPDCLCANPDFKHGLRDCTHEACPGEKVEQVVQAGLQACRDMGGAPGSSTGAPTTGTGSGTTTGTPTSGSGSETTAPSTSGSGSAPAPTSGGHSTPYSTIPAGPTVITSGTHVVTTSRPPTTLYTEVSGSQTGSESSSPTGTGSESTSAPETTSPSSTEGGSSPSSTEGSGNGGSGGSETSGSGNGPSQTPSQGIAPKATGLGVAGAIGLVALLAL
ncbi:hypothetical protein A7D00_1298 [Trichophyton violaceum]|uniref:CFEM domain-containing protein n=1 Tax=Trichophyton violaceum TaxID=34388 RepID=A0A178FUB3_TRIVO|nr:hypothetical protein A7D00_1298 [Trichophyton violaceum]